MIKDKIFNNNFNINSLKIIYTFPKKYLELDLHEVQLFTNILFLYLYLFTKSLFKLFLFYTYLVHYYNLIPFQT